MEKNDDLDEFFDEFLSSKPIFENKEALQANYFPEKIPHREEYLKEIAKILAPSLRLEKCSNLFIYGKTGTGKSLCVKYVSNKMEKIALNKKIPLKIININCKLKKVADTEYRILLEILKLQLQGKKVLLVNDFLNGIKLKTGDLLG